MSRLHILTIRVPLWLSVLTLVLATTPAGAQPVPWLPNSNVEARMVGCPSGDPLPGCASNLFPQPGFTMLVRDMFNLPIMNQPVTLEFTDPAIRIFLDARPGTTVNCAARSISRLTDTDGFVTFAPRIGGTSLGNACEISVSGVLFGLVPVTSTDLDGNGATGLGDFALFAANFLGQSQDRRTDFDGCTHPVDGATTLTDLGILASQFGKGHPNGSCP